MVRQQSPDSCGSNGSNHQGQGDREVARASGDARRYQQPTPNVMHRTPTSYPVYWDKLQHFVVMMGAMCRQLDRLPEGVEVDSSQVSYQGRARFPIHIHSTASRLTERLRHAGAAPHSGHARDRQSCLEFLVHRALIAPAPQQTATVRILLVRRCGT